MFQPKEVKEGQKLEIVVKELARETNHLARTVERIEIKQKWSIYAQPAKFFWFSFLNGLFIALGSTLGVILIIWLSQALGYLPLFGNLFSGLKDALVETRSSLP